MIDRIDNFIRGLDIEAYRVGGSVRDEILGRRCKDADYMVRGISLASLGSLLRSQARHMDRADVRPLVLRDGRQAGWRFSARGLGLIEIMLPRTDVSTGPGHRDFEIVIDPNLPIAEDAKRRDFTFNALYKIVHDGQTSLVAGPNGVLYENIIDPLGGLNDLQRRQVAITYAYSFRDDPLRTLRALRFVSVLGYDLDPQTLFLMHQYAGAVTGLSANGYASGTVLDEMSKILMGDDVRKALRIARDTGVLGTLFPEIAPMLGFDQGSRYHDMTTDNHTFAALDMAARVDAPLRVRWALLFHDAGKPESAWVGDDGRKHYYAKNGTEDHEVVGERIWREVAGRLNAPVPLREDVSRLIRHHMVPLEGKIRASKVRRMRVQFGDDMLRDLLMHRACDASGKGKPNKGHLDRIGQMEAIRRLAAADNVPATPGDLEVTGHDAMAKGYKGREIGEALKALLNQIASQPNERTLSREWQLENL